jgi:two-component system response regulator GlrR
MTQIGRRRLRHVHPHSTTPSLRYRLLICAGAAEAKRAQDLAAELGDGESGELDVTAESYGLPPQQQDVVVQLVCAGELAAAMRQLSALRVTSPGCAVIVAALDLNGAQIYGLLNAGASDFLRAPLGRDELLVRVHRALGIVASQSQPEPRPVHPALRDLIGDSPIFAQQVERIPLLAKYDASVLILGDTGTGKEICAQAIHYLSARARRPWVAVNCGAIPTELIEAELFGHVKGAYTHAHNDRLGLVREAEGGTLFLDEIDSLPYGAQAKLLRFLQDKEYRPVGSNKLMRADVRVIAASNRSPSQLASREVFRPDLLLRLNVLMLHLPLLRERQSDIPQLALHFLHGAARQWQKPVPTLSPAAIRKLLAYDWPGNVRELKNVIERAVLMSGPGPLTAQNIDLNGLSSPPSASQPDESLRAAKTRMVEQFERGYIEHLLACNGGNVAHAARAAKKNRRAFFALMRKYKIESGAFRSRSGIAG